MGKTTRPGSSDDLRIQLLGGFRVFVGDRGVDDRDWRLRKAKSLFKLLALSPSRRLHREQAMEALWPRFLPDSAANNLRKALHMARRALEPSAEAASRFLHLDGEFLTLAPRGALWIDVEAFEQAAGAVRVGDARSYRAAVELYTGDLLPEDRYEDWAIGRREELRARYLDLLVELGELLSQQGENAVAADALGRVVAADPAHESAQLALMRLHAAEGRRHHALRQYQRLRDALRRELGAEPGAAAQALYAELLAGGFPAQAPAAALPQARRRDGETPLVGRDDELELLEEALDRLFEGRGGLVLLAGEAGVGKSRLAAEIGERAQRRGAAVLAGAGREQEGRPPYGPFVEAVDTVRERVPPELGVLVGDGEAPDRARLFASVARFLGDLGPVVLTLDDLHASDEATLQLIHYLARAAAHSRLLMLVTFRAEEVGGAERLRDLVLALESERLARRLDLRRLSRPESDVLVADLLGGTPADASVFQAVFGLAAGNPFYTEEAVRAWRERGQLEQVEGRWRLRFEATAVPAPLVEVIAARLDRLGRTPRQVLDLVAVAGREAPYELLRAAGELPESQLLDALDECLAHRALEETATGYRFDHPLHRQALYERLSEARRANVHGRVARALEALAEGRPGAHADALAHHYLASDEPARAVPYLVLAADRAASVHANEAAIRSLLRAIDLEASPEAVRDLWEKVGDLWSLVGKTEEAGAAYESALGAAGVAARNTGLGTLHRKAAYAWVAGHDAARAEPHLAAAEELVWDGGAPERGRLRRVQAHFLWEQGRLDEALAAAEESLTLAERASEPNDLAAAYETLAIVLHTRGEWKRGLHEEIARLGPVADSPQLAAVFDVHHCIGEYQLVGDHSSDGVEEYARRTIDVATRSGARQAQAFGWCLLGESLLLRGRWDEAAGCLRRSTELHAELGQRSGGLPWQRLAELSVCRGDFAGAEDYARQGMTLATVSPMAMHLWGRLYATVAFGALERDDPEAAVRAVEGAAQAAGRYGDCPSCSALLHPVAAEAHAALGNAAAAADHRHAAEELIGYWESRTWQAMVETAAAYVAAAGGDSSQAQQRLLAAAELYERASQPYWSARSLLQAALAGPGSPDARALLERALAGFDRLGADATASRARRELAQVAA